MDEAFDEETHVRRQWTAGRIDDVSGHIEERIVGKHRFEPPAFQRARTDEAWFDHYAETGFGRLSKDIAVVADHIWLHRDGAPCAVRSSVLPRRADGTTAVSKDAMLNQRRWCRRLPIGLPIVRACCNDVLHVKEFPGHES